MAYSTINDIRAQLDEESLIQLTDDDGAGAVDEARVTRAIADADVEIDGLIGGRYTVPLASPPGLIRKFSVAIAARNLYGRRATVPESRQKDYDNAVRLLEKVGEGKLTLGIDPEPSGGEQEIQTARTADDRTFSTGKTSTGETGSLDNY